MNKQLNRTKIADGVYFNSISSIKFKHNRLSINCLTPLDEKTASANAIVPSLLCKGSKKQPDFSKLNAKLNNLYGAALNTRVSSFNVYQTIGISISTLDNRFALEEEDLVKESAKLLSELFFNPNIDDNNEFDKEILELEKQALVDTIKSEINDKRTYAINRCMKEMYKDEIIATPYYGTIETAQAITSNQAYKAWDNIVRTAPIEIMFVGSGDPTPAIQILTDAFSALDRSSTDYKAVSIEDISGPSKEISETIKGLQQGKLVMGMRCSNLDSLENRNAARLLSIIYGGAPFSKLFLNVREKLSLAYYCSAKIDTTNNFLLVDSGVESANKEKAYGEILSQLKAIQQGEITKEELESTKLLIVNSLETVGDNLGSVEAWYFSQILRGESLSPEEDIANLLKVSIDDIVNISKGITLDTIYFLDGGDDTNE